MADQLDIVNMALGKLGVTRVDSITDVQEAKDVWDLLVDELLHDGKWGFALTRTTLSVSSTPNHDYTYAFDLPGDCLRVLEVEGEGIFDGHDWDREGNQILTRTTPIKILYVFRNKNYGHWPPMFASVFATRLALELAIPLTGTSTIRQSMEAEYARMIAEAKATDSQEGTNRRMRSTRWIRAFNRAGDVRDVAETS